MYKSAIYLLTCVTVNDFQLTVIIYYDNATSLVKIEQS